MKRRHFRDALRRGRTFQAALALALGTGTALLPAETQNAVANGDTRTIQLYHAHTHESISATYLVNGSYDQSVLDKLNWFLRDWRRDEPTKMDPRLFDVIWEVYRESGSRQPVEVMSAYRSPETNAMLRRRSRGVAEHSQHILGKAMDQHYADVPMSKIRELAMRLQRGGVGFYPTAGTPFVHMDVGGVRHWPRMSYDQLARLFPDGKTVHIPSNGQPLPGYELARAELEARGDGSYPTASEVKSKGFFAWLFGGGGDEEEDAAASADSGRSKGPPRSAQVASAARGPMPTPMQMATMDAGSKSGGAMAFLQAESARTNTAAPASAARTPTLAVAPPPPAAPAPDRSADAKLALAMSLRDKPQEQTIAAPPSDAAQVAPLVAPAPPVPLITTGPIVPMPPTRPVALAEADAATPMPPVRPPELTKPIEPPAPTAQQAARLARADGISALLASPASRVPLPAVITQGASRGKAPPTVLAYAGQGGPAGPSPVAAPMPVPRPSSFVSARLDRSNFRSMTSTVTAEKVVPRSALGSSVVGIRAAARAGVGPLASAGAVTTRFGSTAYDLATNRFSGSGPQAVTTVVAAKRGE